MNHFVRKSVYLPASKLVLVLISFVLSVTIFWKRFFFEYFSQRRQKYSKIFFTKFSTKNYWFKKKSLFVNLFISFFVKSIKTFQSTSVTQVLPLLCTIRPDLFKRMKNKLKTFQDKTFSAIFYWKSVLVMTSGFGDS